MKMPCVQNRIYCHDCNKSYIDRKYSNHLRSQGHIKLVMKKRYNSVITRNKSCCSNHDLTCCLSKLSLKSDDNKQIDFSHKQNRTGRKLTIDNSVRYVPQSEQTNDYKNTEPSTLLNLFQITSSR